MIKNSMQLKAKIGNIAKGDGLKAQILIRKYMMERFLERCAMSKYHNHFILKGGMLVSSYVGMDARATMDIDATIKALPLTLDEAGKMIQIIIDTQIDDEVEFKIISAREIMEEHDYPRTQIYAGSNY